MRVAQGKLATLWNTMILKLNLEPYNPFWKVTFALLLVSSQMLILQSTLLKIDIILAILNYLLKVLVFKLIQQYFTKHDRAVF